MSGDQWHPRPAVRALVKLWTELLARRGEAEAGAGRDVAPVAAARTCGALKEEKKKNKDSVPRRGDHLQPRRRSAPAHFICPLLSPAISRPVRRRPPRRLPLPSRPRLPVHELF